MEKVWKKKFEKFCRKFCGILLENQVKKQCKKKTPKAILYQIMRERKILNVTFVVKYLMNNKLQKPY